jgi:hypothetical protein
MPSREDKHLYVPDLISSEYFKTPLGSLEVWTVRYEQGMFANIDYTCLLMQAEEVLVLLTIIFTHGYTIYSYRRPTGMAEYGLK